MTSIAYHMILFTNKTRNNSVSVSYQGVYIPPVLKESPPQSQQSGNSVNGYQSFGSTDHMGRHCPSIASPQINVTPEQTINVEVQGSEDPSMTATLIH